MSVLPSRVVRVRTADGWVDLTGPAGRDAPLIPRVTSLPSNPDEGDMVDFVADTSSWFWWPNLSAALPDYLQPGLWRLCYRPGSDPTYPWEFVGGSPFVAYVNRTDTSVAGTNGVAPGATARLEGRYVAEGGGNFSAAAASANYIAFRLPTGMVGSPQDTYMYSNAPAGTMAGKRVFETRLAAGDDVARIFLYTSSAQVTNWLGLYFHLTPIRVRA